MAPEYGATCGFFPIDDETLALPAQDGPQPQRGDARRALREGAGAVPHDATPEPVFSDTLALDLATVEPSLAGPKRPQDRVPLGEHEERLPRGAHGSGEGPRLRPARRRDAALGPLELDGRARRARARRRGDRRDHELHQHLEPVGDDRRGPARAQGRAARAARGAVRQDQPGARLEGGDRVPAPVGPAARPRGARLPPGRLRLHDLHRQQRAAAARRSRRR